MSKKKPLKEQLEEEEKKLKIFSNFEVPTKPENIKQRIKSETLSIKNKNTILKTVEIGNDPNFKQYINYLHILRKKEEEEYLEYLRSLNRKDPLLSKLDVNKKISFPDFCEKFKINPYLFDYFDYYEIQKINKKKTAELIKKIKERIKREKKQLNSNEKKSTSLDDMDKNYKIFKRRVSLISNKTVLKDEKRLSLENLSDKNKFFIEGIDFNLIKNLYPEIEENDKKYLDLCLNNEIQKERKKFYKTIKDKENSKKNSITNYFFDSDEYTISHTLSQKSQNKLNRLKLTINNKLDRLDKDRPKTSKTLPNNESNYLRYLNYIPNTSKYKHINYQKDLIFNNEFMSNKNNRLKNIFKNKYNNIKTDSNIYSKNNLLTKTNNVLNNVNRIKSVLKRDKIYTSKTITRANTAFKKTDGINAEKNRMEKLMKDNKKSYKKYKDMKEKVEKKRNLKVFKELKEMTKSNEKNGIESTDIFCKTLNDLCKEEKKENNKYKKFLKYNYNYKLEKLQKDSVDTKNTEKNIEKIMHSYELLKLNIKKRYKEINNIIKRSKKKSKYF